MKKIIFAIAFGAAIVSTPAMAQRFGGGGRGHDQTRAEAQQRADMIFQMMDTNRDGVVTKAEAEQALAQFQASRGGDGEGRGGGRMQRMLDQAFGSAESLTLQQFEAQALARFDAEDLNHDGKITPDERQQAREQRMQTAPGTPAPAPQAQ